MFPAGTTITDEVIFKNADGALYDPTTVVLEVEKPGGALIYPTVTRISLGIWRANFTVDRGATRWEWDGITGTGPTAIHDVVIGGTCAGRAVTV